MDKILVGANELYVDSKVLCIVMFGCAKNPKYTLQVLLRNWQKRIDDPNTVVRNVSRCTIREEKRFICLR